MDDKELSTAQVAKKLGISQPHVAYLLRHGTLTGRRLGSIWLVSPESVKLWKKHPQRTGRPRKGTKA